MKDAQYPKTLFTQELSEECNQKKQSFRQASTNAAAHLPDYVDKEMWSAFVETRKAMKVPFTDAAQKLVIRQLMRLHASGWDCNASLEKSAIYGYRGVFEVSKIEREKTKDPALAKIEADRAMAAPMPESIRKKLRELRTQ